MRPGIEMVWRRIVKHQDDVFRMVRGREFTYRVDGSVLRPQTTNHNLHKGKFAKALELVPLKGPGEIQHLRGPSYVYAILMDQRISRGEW